MSNVIAPGTEAKTANVCSVVLPIPNTTICDEADSMHEDMQSVDESLDNFVDQTTNNNKPFLDDGLLSESYSCDSCMYQDKQEAEYYNERCTDTLLGWKYTVHTNSICLTPPNAWKTVPAFINVPWYKRLLYYSHIHAGYFMSKSPQFVEKVNELGAIYDPNLPV